MCNTTVVFLATVVGRVCFTFLSSSPLQVRRTRRTGCMRRRFTFSGTVTSTLLSMFFVSPSSLFSFSYLVVTVTVHLLLRIKIVQCNGWKFNMKSRLHKPFLVIDVQHFLVCLLLVVLLDFSPFHVNLIDLLLTWFQRFQFLNELEDE